MKTSYKSWVIKIHPNNQKSASELAQGVTNCSSLRAKYVNLEFISKAELNCLRKLN